MLDIDMEFKHGILIVRLKGMLNNNTIYLFKQNFEETLENNGIKYVLLNLKKLTFIDEYGLKEIENSYKQIVKNKGKLIICGIDKLLTKSKVLTDNLYQVSEEEVAYEMINI